MPLLNFLDPGQRQQQQQPRQQLTPSGRLNAQCSSLQGCLQDALPPAPLAASSLSTAIHRSHAHRDERQGGGNGRAAGCGGREAGALSASVPLCLQFTGSQRGGLDIRLQLVQLAWGDVQHAAHRGSSRPWGSGKASALAAGLQRWRHDSPTCALVQRAAGLLMLRLVFPSTGPSLCGCLAVAAAAGRAVEWAERRRDWRRQQRRLGSCVPNGRSRVRRAFPNLAGERVRNAAGQMGAWVEAVGSAALALWLAGVVWQTMDPAGFSLAQCVAALVPLASGYAHTSRLAAHGKLKGRSLEEAWRLRHKWAAQLVAPLMSDCRENPPLAGALAFAEHASIRAGLRVEGLGALGAGDASSASPAAQQQQQQPGWGAPSCASSPWQDLSLCLSFAMGGGGGRRHDHHHQQDADPSHAAADAGPAASAGKVPLAVGDSGGGGGGGGQRTGKGPAGSKRLFDPLQGYKRPAAAAAAGAASASGSVLPVLAHACDFEQWKEDLGCCVTQHPHDGEHLSSSSSSSSSSSAAGSGCGAGSSSSGVGGDGSEDVAAKYPMLMPADGESIERVPRNSLFGQGDHAGEEQPLTTAEYAELAARGTFLTVIFLPLLLFGPLLMMVAHALSPEDEQSGKRGWEDPRQLQGGGSSPAEEDWRRQLAGRLRRAVFWLLLQSCCKGGAAFIKWGQWGATREDIFPKDFCDIMSALQDRAPTHSYRQSRREVQAALGRPLEAMFEEFQKKPLASGSIAQVHKARVLGAPPDEWVAVKVRHPRVARNIWLDFRLLRAAAAASERLPALRGLGLKETVSQFSHTMTAQADLRVEAAHLERFYRNFAAVRHSVTQPQPIRATEAVLVESYEAGEGVSRYIGTKNPENTEIVAKGVDTYLKMLLADNFVHTDLHPGNIMVRVNEEDDHHGARRRHVQLILLDFGLAEELTPAVRYHFISFLSMIAKGDADAATSHLLRWSATQNCTDIHSFERGMRRLFARYCDINAKDGIDLDAVLKNVLRLAREYSVSIDSNYAALVIGVCVLVGFATSLDPGVNLMDAAAPCLFMHNLTGRVLGRLYG